MNNNGHYDVIGIAMVEELYKQAEDLYPISDQPTRRAIPLLKRLFGWGKPAPQPTPLMATAEPCGDEMAQPCT